jgi:hypothetical protein
MKRIFIFGFFAGILTGLILLAAAGGEKGRRGLVIRDNGREMIVSTHPAQPMDLDPWRQPRLKFEMRWPKGSPEQAVVNFGFIMASRGKPKLCPEMFVFAGGAWQPIHGARYEPQQSKGGTMEQVFADIDPATFCNIALNRQPAHFRVCEIEFKLAGVEGEDIREAAQIWRKQ